MGFLNNTTITIDAVLTKRGRELLARGRNEFAVTKFALSDDEVDYRLWDTAHPNGTNYYGAVIEKKPSHVKAQRDIIIEINHKGIPIETNHATSPRIQQFLIYSWDSHSNKLINDFTRLQTQTDRSSRLLGVGSSP